MKARISTTVDSELLARARAVAQPTSDATLVDEALRALVDRYRKVEIDASYEAYDRHPLSEPDEWGDLASWLDATSRP